MGCFARTCGISGTGINEDEKVVIIVFNLPYEYMDLNTLLHNVREQHQKSVLPNKIKKVDEKWMKKVLNKEVKNMQDYVLFDFKPVIEVVKGTYNDYGFIKEKEEPAQNEDAEEQYGNDSGLGHLLFHTWAVEFLFDKKIKDIKLDLKFALDLLHKIYFLRRSPVDWMLGQQHPDISEMEKQIALNNRTNEYLNKKIIKYKKDESNY